MPCLGEVQDYLAVFEVLVTFLVDRPLTVKTIAVVASLCRHGASRPVLAQHCRVIECVCTVMDYCMDDCYIQVRDMGTSSSPRRRLAEGCLSVVLP